MADYIERQKAINYVLQLFPSKLKADATMGEQVNYSAWCCAVNCAEECIRAVPPADVVEVVRCKDCKHRPMGEGRDDLEFPDEICPCQCEDFWYNWKPADEWYCGNGERNG